MKIDIVRVKALKGYLSKKLKGKCEARNGKCEFHAFLEELLDIFEFGCLLITQKKNRIRDLNVSLENNIELIFVKMFAEQFDLVFY